MQDSRHRPRRKTLCTDRELKGAGSDASKEKVSVRVGHCLLLPGLPFARKLYPRGDNDISILVDDRAANGARRLLAGLSGSLLTGLDVHCGRAGQSSPDEPYPPRLRHARKAADQKRKDEGSKASK